MTEIDAVMPEGAALPNPVHVNISDNRTEPSVVSENNGHLFNDNDRRNDISEETAETPSAMEVDGIDSEDDLQQKFTENHAGTAEDVENLTKHIQQVSTGNNCLKAVKDTSKNLTENSGQNDADNTDIAIAFRTGNEAVVDDTSEEPQKNIDSIEHKLLIQDVLMVSKLNETDRNNKDNVDKNLSEETQLIETAKDPLHDGQVNNPITMTENGTPISIKTTNNTGIVDLGDDSDEEMDEVPQRGQPPHTDRSICSDSDGAVIIGSDSENEASTLNVSNSNIKSNPQLIDDDDDDCVVIEDDISALMVNELTKRKSIALDSANNSDDSQPPPHKRQRNTSQFGVNQITIKDARSLMPQESSLTKRGSDGVVFPINITPAVHTTSGPPKLVPVSTAPHSALVGLSTINTNANLLPGLTDDMFVLEAPSFIVPYIYEKPPSDNLMDIIKEIESTYKLTKDDLAEAVKTDEFDMMTEQNREDKDEKGGKKKKKRRGGDDPDESWSEETDEDEDDDEDFDSESGLRTKVLIKEVSDDLTALKDAIKPSATVTQSISTGVTTAAKPGQENYFESPLGKFFMEIGVGLVQEFVQTDLIRLQKRKMRKSLGKNIMEFERAISALSGNLEASKKKNAPFKFTMKRCEFCNFKSESALAMANHYETPHMNGPLYRCNFCTFEIRNATEIVYHMEAVHNIKARLIKPLPYHQCPNCGFEDNGKAKLARHQPVCAKKFRAEQNLAPPNDWEAPAKIPRIKPRHGLVGTATAYQAMAAQAAAQKAALATIQQQQQQVAQARSLQAAALAAQNAANKIRGRPPQVPKQGLNSGAAMRGPGQVRNPMATNAVLPNNFHTPSGPLMQSANALAKKTLSGQPSISITPLPRQSVPTQASSPSNSKMLPNSIKPGLSPSGNKAQFVICEICDGYIKDLEQLRNHMQWMHKVKIHPKMIYNRPPLNCQKCQFRFFTDQGLERHLLGSHGLVTSSMQEAANKGKDAGRCPVCGRMYQWKLLNHVSRDHHMTLKPAHLSYKCTVCTATFGMYKQFETHVYTAHSTVAKKAMDGKKSSSAPLNIGASSSQRISSNAASDSLLKPLKINDEITIIPQPASKPRITNIESHVID